MHYPARILLLSCLSVTGITALPSSGIADQPFNYYPAYGAHRGRIVYHQGPFGGSRQKIRWGGGLTDNGAAVLTGAVGAAATIFGPGSSAASTGDKAARDAEFQRSLNEDNDWLQKARDLQNRTETLRNAYLSVSGSQNGKLQNSHDNVGLQSGAIDDFSDWDSNAATSSISPIVPPIIPPAPTQSGPLDTFDDWDGGP